MTQKYQKLWGLLFVYFFPWRNTPNSLYCQSVHFAANKITRNFSRQTQVSVYCQLDNHLQNKLTHSTAKIAYHSHLYDDIHSTQRAGLYFTSHCENWYGSHNGYTLVAYFWSKVFFIAQKITEKDPVKIYHENHKHLDVLCDSSVSVESTSHNCIS